MSPDEAKGLIGAYGFEEKPDDRMWQTRFENGRTFIDIWFGERGTTVGVYNPKTKRMWYKRRVTLESLESILLEVKHY